MQSRFQKCRTTPAIVAQVSPRVPALALVVVAVLLLLNCRQTQGQEPQTSTRHAPQQVQNHQYHAPKFVDDGYSGLKIS